MDKLKSYGKRLVNSTLYDSDDENQISIRKGFQEHPKEFAKKIQTLGTIKDYPVTAILTELGNRILLDHQEDERYQKLKDPLQFQINRAQNKINDLKQDIELIEDNISLLKASSLNSGSNLKISKDQLIKRNKERILKLTAEIKVYSDKLSDLQSLQERRDDLAAGNKDELPLKGAFPFIPKKLSETFCDNCREKLPQIFKNLGNVEIQKYFLDLRNYLLDPHQNLKKDEYTEVFSKIFGKQSQAAGTKANNKQYINSLLVAVTSKLGKYDENDLNEYLRLNRIDSTKSEEVEKQLNAHIKDNLEAIYNLTEKTAHYSLDPDYLKAVAEIKNVLAQTRLYYKIHRDINKNTLVLGGAGQRNYPPGLNTTAKIFSSGANALFLGELGSYREITEENLHTLKKHSVKNTSSAEKGAEFHSLMQIEALRSAASILANNMFFYLSRPNKEFMNAVGIKYERSEIDKLMPMAMKGAVGGVTCIENEVGKSLSSRIKYDYRHGDKKDRMDAELLEIKNYQIMFDFICAKSRIVDRHNGKVLDISSSPEWKHNTKPETNIITATKDNYEFELQKINNEYKIIKIKTFPAKIISELIEREYGPILPDYMKDGKFKVEVNAIASKELRDLNIKILELEKNKKLGRITFQNQEITELRKDFNELNLALYAITSTEKSKKPEKNNASNYPSFKEKLSKLKSDLSPENTLTNLKDRISLIRQSVTQKQMLNKINSLEGQLLRIDNPTKLLNLLKEWEKLEEAAKKLISTEKKKQENKKSVPTTSGKNTPRKNLNKTQKTNTGVGQNTPPKPKQNNSSSQNHTPTYNKKQTKQEKPEPISTPKKEKDTYVHPSKLKPVPVPTSIPADESNTVQLQEGNNESIGGKYVRSPSDITGKKRKSLDSPSDDNTSTKKQKTTLQKAAVIGAGVGKVIPVVSPPSALSSRSKTQKKSPHSQSRS